MTTIRLNAPPPLSVVVAEQIRAVWLQLRLLSALLVGAFLLYAAVAARVATNMRNANEARHGHSIIDLSFTPEASRVIAILALMVPSVIWNGEDPTRRTYHWAMPVDRATHAWIRTLAGWVWVIAVTTAYVVTIIAVDALATHIIGTAAPRDPTFRNWEWAVPFTAMTVAYVLASAAAVGTRTPVVWIVGPFAIYTGATLLLGGLGYDRLGHAMMKLISGYYGILAAIAGKVGTSDSGRAAFDATPSAWLSATAVWGGIGLVLLFWVARRRAE